MTCSGLCEGTIGIPQSLNIILQSQDSSSGNWFAFSVRKLVLQNHVLMSPPPPQTLSHVGGVSDSLATSHNSQVLSSVITGHQLTHGEHSLGAARLRCWDNRGDTPSRLLSGSLASLDEYGFPGSAGPATSAWVGKQAHRRTLWSSKDVPSVEGEEGNRKDWHRAVLPSIKIHLTDASNLI